MIILDTNVLSEVTRQAPDADVLAWLDSLPAAEVATTAITAAELLYGVTRLPDGHRKTSLNAAVHALINDDFHGRVEPFDAPAAAEYAVVVSERERLGRPISAADAQIAAICRARRATLATRNTKDFEETGIELVNPWYAN
ncbi:type II toxin-antitoxin system VapC family toxin [Saccharopolyspora elongata]|uniref:Ribonuclease VapC n=1 Tax=Saccharopolyspora elongata TaxID=2530387 RepID=A0A4R4YR46_9PSEU|nr:type II toxin-antitoxin system VapC family toxin [Saccharopolyspora elongata]TDD47708.1 type II toxin-antitoxin system VapC family toxin [Saccharopolyspora elongata]